MKFEDIIKLTNELKAKLAENPDALKLVGSVESGLGTLSEIHTKQFDELKGVKDASKSVFKGFGLDVEGEFTYSDLFKKTLEKKTELDTKITTLNSSSDEGQTLLANLREEVSTLSKNFKEAQDKSIKFENEVKDNRNTLKDKDLLSSLLKAFGDNGGNTNYFGHIESSLKKLATESSDKAHKDIVLEFLGKEENTIFKTSDSLGGPDGGGPDGGLPKDKPASMIDLVKEIK